MKLRRFQYSTSTDMSGARTNPVLRREMPTRQPVLRRVNNYLRDPKAGQRDMNLEVAAAGRGKYLANAVSKGMMQLGETLAQAEAQALATDALMDYRKELTVAEYNAQGLPFTRTESHVDPSSGSIKEREVATHKDLVPTFDKATKGIIDSYIGRLPLAVRNQVRGQMLNLGAAARDRVVNMAIKKQMQFGQHTVFSSIQKAESPEAVEGLINSANARLYFSAIQLNTMYEEKMGELAIRGSATRIVLAANSGVAARGHLQEEKERVIDGSIRVQLTNSLGEVVYTTDDKGRTVALMTDGIDPLHKFLTGEQILQLHSKIKAIEVAMDKKVRDTQEDEINHVLNDITATRGDLHNASDPILKRYAAYGSGGMKPDGTSFEPPSNWEDIIRNMAREGSHSILEGSDITALMARVKAAREGDIVDPEQYSKILEHLEEYATKEGRDKIRRTVGLGELAIRDLQDKSRKMERAGENWWESNNPFGNRGSIAITALKGHFDLIETPDSGVFAKFSTKEKASAVHQAYQTLLKELHDHVDGIGDARLKPEAALKWVYEKIDEDNKAGRPLATGGKARSVSATTITEPSDAPDAPAATTVDDDGTINVASPKQTNAQKTAHETWLRTQAAKDEEGNAWTKPKVTALPAGALRDGLAVVLEAHGIVIPPAAQKPEVQTKSLGDTSAGSSTVREVRPRTGIWPPSELPSNPFALGYHLR
jgi:hypothetical protein